jgi:ELWxxDGT repeat protein
MSTPYRVRDIAPGASSSDPRYLTAVGNTLFFVANDGSNGTELWKTDGTTTTRVADINPGAFSSNPKYLTAVGNTLFFSAKGGSSGTELWKTDGTTTTLVADIRPGSSSSNPASLTVVGATLYFVAIDSNGYELWKADGTTTSRVADINPGVFSSNPRNLTAVGNTLFFVAYNGSNGTELWKTDGTTTTLVADINPGLSDSNPAFLTSVGNTLFFRANDGSSGTELWKTDGTTTTRVADIVPGASGSNPKYLTAVGNTCFFQASDSSGRELWKTDGTTTSRVADIHPGFYTVPYYPGPKSSSPNYLTAAGNTLFFVANDRPRDRELWKSDGITTTRVADINPGGLSSNPRYLTAVGNTLFFRANDGSSGYELWALDTLPGITLPSITLAVSPAAVAEDGVTNLVYTFTRTGDTTSALIVSYAVAGAAVIGADYTGISATDTNQTVTFSSGSATATVTVDPTADSTIEADETVALALAAGSGYTVGTTTAVTGTITNDDVAPPSITLAVASASITEDGAANLIYTFTRTGPTTSALTVNYGITGTADATDYTGATPGAGKTITFALGSATAALTIDPTADTSIEADEAVALTLAAGTGYSIGTTAAVVGTILNDDLPVITLAVAPTAGVTEDGTANLIYTFSRTGSTTSSLTVNYTVGGTAMLGTDYTGIASTPATKTVSFAAGSATVTVTVDPTVDSMIEPDETVSLTLAAGTGYSIGTTAAVVGTILNDDSPVITLAVAPTAGVTEDGTANLVYTFSRTGPTSSALSVKYTVGGTATLGTDFTGIAATPVTKTVSFAANSAIAIVTVNPTADTTIESDETVALTLAAGTGYSIGTTAAVVGTILNDDSPVITLAVAPTAGVTEDGTTNLVYTFSRTGPTSSALSVKYTVGGTATLGTDYSGIGATHATKTVSFAAGSATATVTVDPTVDTTIESDETVALTLAAGTGYSIGTTAAVVGTILNDDVPVITLAVAPTAGITEDGTANLIYTFSRTGSTTSSLTVNYTVGGTAMLGMDYTGIASTPATKTVTFAAGATTATVTVDPKTDTTIEADETVALTIAAGSGYSIGTTAAVVGTILNDDSPVITLAVAPTTGTAEDGTANLVYTFSRTGPTSSALSVKYTVGGTATLGTDYTGIAATPTTKTVTFAAGATTATLTIDPKADTTIEANETVALTLAAGTGYSIGTTAAVVGTILNDDSPVITLAVAPTAGVTEDGTTNLVYTFSRTGPTSSALSVKYTVGGTATLGTDYSGIGATHATKTVSFAAGSATATVTVDPKTDTTIEANETVALTLAAGTGYSIGTTAAVVGTITNDDVSSSTTYTLSPTQSSLQLLGGMRINGIGNDLNNTITGNKNNNKLHGLLGADTLTGGGTADSDVFAYNSLGESLLGTGSSFDIITDFNNKDFILTPLTLAKIRLSSAIGSVNSLTSASIEGLLTASSFAANSVAAFTVAGQVGTYIAMNDGRGGFQADSDAIVFLPNYAISNVNFVEFI